MLLFGLPHQRADLWDLAGVGSAWFSSVYVQGRREYPCFTPMGPLLRIFLYFFCIFSNEKHYPLPQASPVGYGHLAIFCGKYPNSCQNSKNGMSVWYDIHIFVTHAQVWAAFGLERSMAPPCMVLCRISPWHASAALQHCTSYLLQPGCLVREPICGMRCAVRGCLGDERELNYLLARLLYYNGVLIIINQGYHCFEC